MLDPWVGLAALSLWLAAAPALPNGDPGPSPLCPTDMRLVEGDHYQRMSHLCLDPRADTKDVHCYHYAAGLSLLEGPVTHIRVCMDRFEAPNRRGAAPLVMQSFRSAGRWCAQRGKRVCHEREWELGCEGPTHQPLAYGWQVNVRLCNSAKRWKTVDFSAFGHDRDDALAESRRLWQGEASGRYQSCLSPFGIYDMMGNVEEWVASRASRRWPGALMGGFWAKPWTGCRGTNDAHRPSFAFYETGFRCCQTPKSRAAATTAPPTGSAPAAR